MDIIAFVIIFTTTHSHFHKLKYYKCALINIIKLTISYVYYIKSTNNHFTYFENSFAQSYNVYDFLSQLLAFFTINVNYF